MAKVLQLSFSRENEQYANFIKNRSMDESKRLGYRVTPGMVVAGIISEWKTLKAEKELEAEGRRDG